MGSEMESKHKCGLHPLTLTRHPLPLAHRLSTRVEDEVLGDVVGSSELVVEVDVRAGAVVEDISSDFSLTALGLV